VKRFEQVFIDEGFEKGKEIGVEIGVEIGMEKGVEIGMEKGIELERQKQQQEKIELVKAMILEKMSDSQIVKLTKIALFEIQKIRQELKKT